MRPDMAAVRNGQGSEGAATVAVRGESGAAADQPILTSGAALSILRLTGGQLLLYAVLLILLIVTFIPIVYLVALSLKDNGQIYGRFWSMPDPYRWENFALGSLAIWRAVLNSILTSGTSTAATVLLASLSGYVFARHRFPGKELIYTGILALLMIPPILTLIPAYVLILNMGLENTYWALILPWTSGGQVFALLLCRSFFATLPEEFFDAARIDGASELQSFAQIAVPLSAPILVTVAVVRLVTTYNQFMWPLVVISSPKKQVVAVALTQFTSEIGVTDLGPQMAGYILASIPLIVLFSFGMRHYVRGLTAGGLKA
ncbi:MAG: carbohydrate ABC transporter permease [Caldilineaceae bacterium SB0661_bin_32]|uniref:Carbohydrate ABC transporter permease n=1 Tax=Caldilineaceae bacterium SB0661_bin_32 TaxID=2605255 RepID=A0A6B1D5H7_9CHLR|nr:carbohydrate ABC transporter permease [Caldilineaceae bacterium SB0661_bin_32]